MNEYDSNRMLDLAKLAGYTPTTKISDTDCYILNTCHIREKATDKVYHDVGRLKKEFRGKKKPILIIAGCVAQAEGNEMLKREPYIDGVVGPQSYQNIPSIIKNIEDKKTKVNCTEFEVVEKFDKLNLIKNKNSKVSAFLTIQEGCDKFCHFCVVPYTRGPEHSRSFNEILKEAKELIKNGTKEIVLLGQNVNAYNYKDYTLSDLIIELNNFNDLLRIRYTTSHPKDMTADLIDVHESCTKLMPSLHLPVQSGSSEVLKSMNRKHTIEEYVNILKKLKIKKPNIKFSSDFIIGYPGESEDDFNSTLLLMEKIKFINSYSFVYSARPGTPASNLKEVDSNIAKERLKIFQNKSDEIKKEHRKKILDTEIEVLFENKLSNQERYFGRDQYSNSVVVDSKIDLTGKLVVVKIDNFNNNTLFGKIDLKKKYMAA
jgi:tRNA-2-methylthio-N6-dimethylallyladenosine synthase